MVEAVGKRAKVGLSSLIQLQFHHYPGLARAGQSLYGAARIGDLVVNRSSRPTPSGWTIILVSAAVLALGGCGRKGILDLPPNTPPQAAAAAQEDADHEPAAPKGRKKAFALDPLLD